MNIRTRSFIKKFIFLSLSILSMQSLADSVTVMHPYARAVVEGHPNSAAFMMLKNTTAEDRALVNAKSSVSKVVELHTHINENGVMRMRRVEKIGIKANSKTELKPGGLHVMFIGLYKGLNEGDKVDLELIFDNGESSKLSIPVKKVMGMMHKKHHN